MRHYRQVKWRGSFLCAAQSLEVVATDHARRQSHFDPDDDVSMPGNGAARQGDVGGVNVSELATGYDARARNVDQRTPDLRRGPYDRSERIDVIGAGRPRIDKSRDAVLESQRGCALVATRMSVNVDEPRRNDLTARLDRVGGIARDIGLNGGDAPTRDGHITDTIEPDGRVDHSPASDDQVVRLRVRPREMRGQQKAGSPTKDFTSVYAETTHDHLVSPASYSAARIRAPLRTLMRP